MVEDSLKMAHEHDSETDEENNYDNDYFENESTSLLRNNPVENQQIENRESGISWYFAVFLIVNAALGAGLLNFAKAFDNAGGILVSSIVHLVIQSSFYIYIYFNFLNFFLRFYLL